MKLILRVGGHLLFKEDSHIDARLVKAYVRIIKELREEGHMIHLVVGGGDEARKYISALSELRAPKAIVDYVGTIITRANAYLFLTALGELAFPLVPESYKELLNALSSGKVVVCGGLQPGQSTVAVAALMAETVKADMLINATDVDGIYTADPKIDPSAKLLRSISAKELLRVLRSGRAPGTYQMFDEVALCIIMRSKIKAWVINGYQPQNILKLVRGEHVGTLVLPD